jgi:NADH dehydrogenase
MVVLVTGASGLLGREVVRELLERNYEVRALVHTPGRERVFQHGTVDVYYGGVNDPDALASACRGVEAVIHLVAVIRQGRGVTYERVNRQGVANVAAAAKASGSVKHFVHLSAIGAVDNPRFPYLRSKWQGEQEVVNSGLPYTILRPSVLFGPGDEFINALAALVRAFPVVPVIGSGNNRLQPIAVQDVARCVVLSLDRGDLKGRVVEIGGPRQLSYNEIVRIVGRTLARRRLRLHIPVWLMWLNVALMQLLVPRPPLTREMLRMLPLRNVAELGVVEDTFGFAPRPLEGNIDFIRSLSLADALRISLGLEPAAGSGSGTS